MAIALITEALRHARTMKLAHTAAVEAREVIVSGGNVLVAYDAAEADTEAVYMYNGRVNLPKGAGAIAAGVPIYWDATAGQATTVETANTRAGISLEEAADTDEYVHVKLREN